MSESMIRDISLADEGLQRISWVEKFMPALNTLREEFVKEQIFKGKTIVMSIHLEAKTVHGGFGKAAVAVHARRQHAHAGELHRFGDEVHRLLQGAYFPVVDFDFRLVVEVAVPHPVGEVETHQLLDAIFHHIADNQRYEQRPGKVSEMSLEGPGNHGGKDHRHPGRKAEIGLLDQNSVFLFRDA